MLDKPTKLSHYFFKEKMQSLSPEKMSISGYAAQPCPSTRQGRLGDLTEQIDFDLYIVY